MNEQNPENPTQSDIKSDTPTNKSDTIRPFRQRKTTTKEKKEFMLEVLENQLGIVMIACKQVGISRETHYHWVKKDPKYAKAVAEVVYNVKDFGEHALFKLIKEGNPMAVWNFNKTRNRDRGYGEHIGIEHTDKDREHIFNIIVKSNEEIRAEKEHKNTQKSA